MVDAWLWGRGREYHHRRTSAECVRCGEWGRVSREGVAGAGVCVKCVERLRANKLSDPFLAHNSALNYAVHSMDAEACANCGADTTRRSSGWRVRLCGRCVWVVKRGLLPGETLDDWREVLTVSRRERAKRGS